MDEFEVQEIIEAYWCDNMSPEDRAAFERQMQSDPALAQQVEDWRLVFLATDRLAQKELQNNFSKWKSEVSETKIPLQKPTFKWWWLISLAALTILTLLVTWRYFGNQNRQENKPLNIALEAEKEEKSSEIVTIDPADTPLNVISNESLEDSFSKKNAGKESTQLPKKAEIEYFAMADPANFSENQAMEMMIGGLRGGSDLSLVMISPQNGRIFQPDNNGQTQLYFSGKGEEAEPNSTVLLDLLIFDNKDINKQKLTVPLKLAIDSNGNITFEIIEKVDFYQGLYYFQIVKADSGEIPKVGKFFIGIPPTSYKSANSISKPPTKN
jgi:hypothetical protein